MRPYSCRLILKIKLSLLNAFYVSYNREICFVFCTADRPYCDVGYFEIGMTSSLKLLYLKLGLLKLTGLENLLLQYLLKRYSLA